MKTRKDFDYSCECGYHECTECDHVAYPMEVENSECPKCLAAMVFHEQNSQTAKAFETPFDTYVCEGDMITGTLNGYDLTARVERDYDTNPHVYDCYTPEAVKAWKDDEWYYCGIVLSVSRNGVTVDDHAASLWGIECNYPGSDNAYLLEVANELTGEAVEQADKERARLIDALSR